MKLPALLELIIARSILTGVLLVFPAFVIWGIWSIITNDVSRTDDERTQQLVWIEQSKDAVRARLKDSRSAEFKDVFFNRASGTPMTCGQVNSKNSLGGYTGYQRFVASGDTLAFFENETEDFSVVWAQYCTR